MKKNVLSTLVTCCLFILGAAATSYAQMPGSELRATIPFDFSVRGKTLPAGKYEVRRVNDSPEALIISHEGSQAREHAIFNTESLDARKIPDRGQIVFHRYGDTYFLSEILIGGERMGRELPQSRQERRLRSEMASNGSQAEPETVALAVY
jgi:hypothetical protein